MTTTTAPAAPATTPVVTAPAPAPAPALATTLVPSVTELLNPFDAKNFKECVLNEIRKYSGQGAGRRYECVLYLVAPDDSKLTNTTLWLSHAQVTKIRNYMFGVKWLDTYEHLIAPVSTTLERVEAHKKQGEQRIYWCDFKFEKPDERFTDKLWITREQLILRFPNATFELEEYGRYLQSTEPEETLPEEEVKDEDGFTLVVHNKRRARRA